MALILLVLSGFILVAGVRLATFSDTPLHAYQAFVLFLIASILFVGAAVIESINTLRRQITARD
jgi:hypothetical protein